MEYKFYEYRLKEAYMVDIEEVGDSLEISWGFTDGFDYIKRIVKGCEGSRWDPSKKLWTVKHPRLSPRNAALLGYATDGKLPDTSNELRRALKRALYPVAEYTLHPSVRYRKYQLEDLYRALGLRRGTVAWDMGLGKTLLAMTVLDYVSVVWPSEDDQAWVTGSTGAVKAWESQLREWPFKINPRLMVNSATTIRKHMEAARRPPRVLINDESGNLRHKSQRTTLILELTRLMRLEYGEDYFVLNLSGTPDPKDPTDWFYQMEITWPGVIMSRDKPALLERLAIMRSNEGAHGTYRTVGAWIPEEIQKLGKAIAPFVIRRSKKDPEVAPELPEIMYIERKLEPTADIIAAARMAVETAPKQQLYMVLRQLSDGFRYINGYKELDDGTAKRVREGINVIHGPKDEQLVLDLEELEENDQTRVVIWAAFQGSIDKIVNICLKQGWNVIKADGRSWTTFHVDESITLEPTQDQFQLRNLDMKIAFVGNPSSAGEGLTLHKADTAIYYSNPHRADHRFQSVDRIHRIGMKSQHPRVIDYIHLPTDKLILQSLQMKKDLSALTAGAALESLASYTSIIGVV